jgi:hypothetical protein
VAQHQGNKFCLNVFDERVSLNGCMTLDIFLPLLGIHKVSNLMSGIEVMFNQCTQQVRLYTLMWWRKQSQLPKRCVFFYTDTRTDMSKKMPAHQCTWDVVWDSLHFSCTWSVLHSLWCTNQNAIPRLYTTFSLKHAPGYKSKRIWKNIPTKLSEPIYFTRFSFYVEYFEVKKLG